MASQRPFHVLTVGDGLWRTTPRPLVHADPTSSQRAVVNGAAYFLLNPVYTYPKFANHGYEPDSIHSFDLATEE